jgi:purine-binding chemotaxis protein CheW
MTEQTSSVNESAAGTDLGRKLAGKYLTFLLGEEEYGLEILKVQEIIQMQKVTKVPKAPDFVRGVINLRGKVIPVIELRNKFGMEHQEDTEKTCIIVVMVEAGDRSITMGIIIDEVKEVLDIEAGNIEETPSFGASIDTDFIMGIGKMGENVKMLLDIDRVLSLTELDALKNARG